MKPNVLKEISTVLWIILLMLFSRITSSLGHNHPGTLCSALTMHSHMSQRYVRIHDNSVFADSGEKYVLHSIRLPNSIQFYLYDENTERFICVNKAKQKLVAKRIPDNYCTFEERIFEFSTSYVQYVQPNANYTMRFTERGTQATVKKIRHKHKTNDMAAFLPKDRSLDRHECDQLKRSLCAKMRGRKKTRRPKTFTKIRTLVCKSEKTA